MKFQVDDMIFFFEDRWSGAPVLRQEIVTEVLPGYYVTARLRRVREADAFSTAAEAIKDVEIRYAMIVKSLTLRYAQ